MIMDYNIIYGAFKAYIVYEHIVYYMRESQHIIPILLLIVNKLYKHYIYIYIYICTHIQKGAFKASSSSAANLRTKILDFGGLDSGRTLILRGGILMPIGNFPESLSQVILAGRFLVGRLGVHKRDIVHHEYMALAKNTSVLDEWINRWVDGWTR